jgi:hypothetical protein
MKKTAKKMTLNRETLRYLNAQNLADAGGGQQSYPDPPSQASCIDKICPNDPVTQYTVAATNCA